MLLKAEHNEYDSIHVEVLARHNTRHRERIVHVCVLEIFIVLWTVRGTTKLINFFHHSSSFLCIYICGASGWLLIGSWNACYFRSIFFALYHFQRCSKCRGTRLLGIHFIHGLNINYIMWIMKRTPRAAREAYSWKCSFSLSLFQLIAWYTRIQHLTDRMLFNDYNSNTR